MRRLRALLCCVLIALFSLPAFADDDADEADLHFQLGTTAYAAGDYTAVINVQTDPPGATVYVDRKNLGARGESPQRLGLPAGSYTIIVEKEGYEPARSATLSVQAGQTVAHRVKLVPILGQVRVESNVGSRWCPPSSSTLIVSRKTWSRPVRCSATT